MLKKDYSNKNECTNIESAIDFTQNTIKNKKTYQERKSEDKKIWLK